MPKVEVKINDYIFSGWKSVSIQRDLTSISGAAVLQYTEQFLNDKISGFDIHNGAYIEIESGGFPFLNGYIDTITNEGTSKEHTLSIMARDVTGDLVDSCHTGETIEWGQPTPLIEIVTELCAPFEKIKVEGGAGENASWGYQDNKINRAVYQQGEKVFTMISRLCASRGILPICHGDTKLVLDVAGNRKTEDGIILGYPKFNFAGGVIHNAVSWNVVESNVRRHSEIQVKGQNNMVNILGPDLSEESMEELIAPYGASIDTGITRHRPIILVADVPGDTADMKVIADQEVMERAGDSRSLQYEVLDWFETSGVPWRVNTVVPIRDSINDVNKDLLISKIRYTYSITDGTSTRMTLVDPKTYLSPKDIGDDEASQVKGTFDPRTPEPAQG